FLNLLQDGEKPTEQITGLSVFWIKHDGNGELMISDKNSLNCRSTQVINRALRLDTTDDGGEKGFRIRCAFENRSHERSAKQRRGIVTLADSFSQEFPIGRKFRIGAPFS